MDHNNGDHNPSPDSPFSFQQLLCGDDWHRWDTFPTVDVSVNSLDQPLEVNHDDPMIMDDPVLLTLTGEETAEQWLQNNEQIEISSRDEDIYISSDDENSFEYEELLDLAEQIGNVCTGLNVEIIDERLSRRKYEDSCGEREKCVICLYELKYNEEASKLGCGHDFHFGCIKKWLMVKNMCPLCKQTAI